MKPGTIVASAATLVTTIQAADVTVSYMTMIGPGSTETIPVGLDTSSTLTMDGFTVSGTATIVNDVAVIVDATAVYMDDLSKTSGLVRGGNGPQVTNIDGDVTVIGGTIQGLSAATATDSSSQASAASSSPSSSSTGHSGASRIEGGQAIAMAGLGGAVVAALI